MNNGKRDDGRKALGYAYENDGMQDVYSWSSYFRKCLLAYVRMACIYRVGFSCSRSFEVNNALL